MTIQPRPPLTHSNPFASRYVRPGAMSFRLTGDGDLAESLGTNERRQFVENFLTRLRLARCGAIVGNHGTGKSTLLRELAARLESDMPGGAWVQLTQSLGYRETLGNIRTLTHLQRTIAPGGVLVIDGAEQIPALVRRWIAHRCRRSQQFVLATSHHDLAGFETLHRTGLTPTLIHELLDELLSQRDHDSPLGMREGVQNHLQSINLADVENLRDLWNELYEVAESHREDESLFR